MLQDYRKTIAFFVPWESTSLALATLYVMIVCLESISQALVTPL